MTADTVNLVVKVPMNLRRRAKAVARLRGETVSDVVRAALMGYVTASESATSATLVGEIDEEEASDAQFARVVLARIAEGAPTYSYEEVWAEIDRLEAAGALPD